jgi:carbamoyltransferase
MLEKIVLHLLVHYRNVTKQTNLCLAGGVAHNCSMNGKILYSGLFKQVFVQPAAHDAGGALGAAYNALNEHRRHLQEMKMDHLYHGTDIGDGDSIEKSLKSWGDFITYEKVERITEKTAQLLAGGQVVGWVQGRSEFGPRALGNRSILADPRPAENKLLINEMVKKRESYRPFAPSVLEERVRDFFDDDLCCSRPRRQA